MADPITATVLCGVALTKTLETVVNDLYEAVKQKGGTIIKACSVKSSIRCLREHAESTRKVKTLWQVDKAVDLLEFYCDSHILFRPNNSASTTKLIRRKVSSVDDFCTPRSVLIQGIAGQGKSTLLRYLCSVELAHSKRIPLFIELHRIQAGETLAMHITRSLAMLGIKDIDRKLMEQLCETNKLLFFLDGFDEVPECQRASIINEIEQLDSLSTGLFVISSRPDSGIDMSARLDVVRLDDLRNDEYKEVIQKLTVGLNYANTLISRVEKHTGLLRDLLCTPLLVTLLVISYKSYQELPNQLSDFYERIFQDLLQRHDGAKPGFRRVRRCELNDAQYRQVFDCLCYYSKPATERSFKYDALQKLAKQAIEKCSLKSDPQEFITDILKVTCLILQDGGDCRFIHKSVQEYYAASYVRSRVESVAKQFYDHCLEDGSYCMLTQELMYLKEIDPYRYRKYFSLPKMCSVLDVTTDAACSLQPPKITREKMLSLFGHLELGFSKEDNPLDYRLVSQRWSKLIFPSDWVDHWFFMSYKPLQLKIEGTALEQGKPISRVNPLFLTVNQLVESGFMIVEFEKTGQCILDKAYESICEDLAFIKREDACDMTLPQI